MSFWIEVHCDNQSSAVDGTGATACISASGNQSGAATFQRPSAVARELLEHVKRQGWVIDAKGRATCPVCVKHWAKVKAGS